jgi:hypothetical protein
MKMTAALNALPRTADTTEDAALKNRRSLTPFALFKAAPKPKIPM